jgi:glycolate oxidase FAD binding subunit
MGTAELTLDEGLARLAAIAGQAHTRVRGETIEVAPADAREAAAILRFADENGLAVTPAGGGTKLGWGNPVEAQIRLSLERMNALREHSWQDMTCTVEAGGTWAAMQTELAHHGQSVALDPLWPERATVGGIVAANDSGALRLKYGALRDLIIGMTVVLADGTIAKSGGKVVKNVAGYDLHKLMTGSFGTLGVITGVNFRLHPAEERTQTWTANAADVAGFAEPLRALLDTQMVPSSVQLRAGKEECALDVRVAGRGEAIVDCERRLKKIFGGMGLVPSGETVWQARQALFDAGDSIILKASMLPAEVCPVSAEVRQWAAAEGAGVECVAYAFGLMTLALHAASDATAFTESILARLRARLRPTGGSVVVLAAPEETRAKLDVWGCHSDALGLMREIKRRFDPNRILNPGRFVGNI